ncbi:ABC transporter ATP-binding protein [Alpinimonas psychrophila]|nr:ATP-binding cassette domain-containing protein [Alpinimonas psychrophila]
MPTSQSTAGAHVSARGWSWRYGSRSRPMFNLLDLDIDPGERVLLLGASGSGKSTLVAGLAGVLGEDEGHESGQLLIDGQPSRHSRGRVGLVLQDPENQVILHRVGDDVAFGCENLGVPQAEIWQRVRAALAAVGLNQPLDHSTAELSGGQKQRLALAGVLAMRPGLIILDEPTANLDPDGVREIRDAVEAVARESGATLLIVEHRVDIWWDLATRVIVLDSDGSILRDGAPASVLEGTRERLTEAGIWLPDPIASIPTSRPLAPILLSTQGGSSFLTLGPLLQGSALTVGRRIGGPAAATDLSINIDSAQVHAVVGPNGSGKSTLALTLAGLIPVISGSVQASTDLAGNARGRHPIDWRSRELMTRIGMVFQSPEHQFLTGSVREELMVGPRALDRRGSRFGRPTVSPHVAEDFRLRIDELLERLHLAHLAEAHPFTLSGGEKRRLSVATALATAPRVLILDEPTFGQDARTWAELVTLFAELRDEGHAIVTITHDEKLVAELADIRTTLPDPATNDLRTGETETRSAEATR